MIAITDSVDVSITDTVSGPVLVTYAWEPSGLTATADATLPTEIVATTEFAGFTLCAGGVGVVEVVGVEGIGQASMKAALGAGRPVDLHDVDIFCDGTAVRKAGE